LVVGIAQNNMLASRFYYSLYQAFDLI